jgi:hypothetical protein
MKPGRRAISYIHTNKLDLENGLYWDKKDVMQII